MADFNDKREAFRQARQVATDAQQAAYASARRAERLARRLVRANRVADTSPGGDVSARDAIQAELDSTLSRHARDKAHLDQALGAQLKSLVAFTPLSDPRKHVGELHDSIPILMLPLRLETRFKQVGDRWELWVRVFPDDWAVDGFEPMLSEQELADAAVFWGGWWAAAGDDGARRAAWRALVASHGEGRAIWTVQRYRPLDEALEPGPDDPEDLALVIPAVTAPDVAIKNTLDAYWVARWKAGDDVAQQQAAWTVLVDALGEAAATDAVAVWAPMNLSAEVSGVARADATLALVWLLLPDPADDDAKTASWTQPAHTEVLPERLVLLMRQGDGERVELGAAIPPSLVLGPDPTAGATLGPTPPPAPGEVGAQIDQENGELVFPPELAWMFDFDTALSVGMGFRIALSSDEAEQGFDRLFVLGVNLRDEPATNAERFKQLLLNHQHSSVGCAIVSQGSPTNNTESGSSSFAGGDDADTSFDRAFGEPPDLAVSDPAAKLDGQWLAEWLGIPTDTVARMSGVRGRDQCEARAANVALWPATVGYTMESMLGEVFAPAVREQTRAFFNQFVIPRGVVPALRIGDQPYGILPATAFSRLEWPFPIRPGVTQPGVTQPGVTQPGATTPEASALGSRYLARYYSLVKTIDADWDSFASNVAHIHQSGDAHQALLDSLGLHAASVEHHQRWSDSLDYYYNLLTLQGYGPLVAGWIIQVTRIMPARTLLQQLGWESEETPALLERIFHTDANLFSGPLVDDVPLSEELAVRAYTADGRNYIRWLRDTAGQSLDTLRNQVGFEDGAPRALLYKLLRHALQLSWWDTGVRLQVSAMPEAAAEEEAILRREPTFIHVGDTEEVSTSRYQALYAPAPVITGNDTVLLADHIQAVLATSGAAVGMREVLEALEHLEDTPTARLERVLVEHLDACTYRLDAWKQALTHYALTTMRFGGTPDAPRTGLHLGVYGWLEDVRRRPQTLSPKTLPAPLAEAFGTDTDPVLVDADNQGHLLAPSLNHAVTAAILRNGYLSDATPTAPDTLAVDLSSRRVRHALSLIEGVRNDQSLGALLGYQFERALHDEHELAETDEFIFALRTRFPLVANKLTETEEALAPGESIEEIEARNVIDALALIEHVDDTGEDSYPFGLNGLPGAAAAQRDKIDAALRGIRDNLDAVADLAVAESVHLAVQGRSEAAGATLDAYGKAQMPPTPEVVSTPRDGRGLTQRFVLRFDPAAPEPADWAALSLTPRALAAPILNRWLGSLLPKPEDIVCAVEREDGVAVDPVSVATLGLAPLDLLYLLVLDGNDVPVELDARLAQVARSQAPPLRPDLRVTVRYTETVTGKVTLFELAPMIRSLRSLVLKGRPMGPDDVVRRADEGETESQKAAVGVSELAPVNTAKTERETLAADLTAFIDTIAPQVVDDTALSTHRATLIANASTRAAQLGDLARRAAERGALGASLTRQADFDARFFADLRELVGALVTDWERRAHEFDGLIARFDLMPGAAPERVRFQPLQRAERLVTTTTSMPLPSDASAFRATLMAARSGFGAKLTALRALLESTAVIPLTWLNEIKAVLPLTAFDPADPDLAPFEERLVQLNVELHRAAVTLRTEVSAQVAGITEALAAHAAASSDRKRLDAADRAARAAFGEDFVTVPSFSFTAEQATELTSVHGQSEHLLRHVRDDLGRAFPLEDWLYSASRVRQQLAEWEYVTMAAEDFSPGKELELTAWQFPFLADDHWLGAEVPEGFEWPDGRLLVTSYGPLPFDATQPSAGLVIDEWTEVIPVEETTTGLIFHYDQPGSEPPQAMLLLTPTQFRGAWQWADVVDAVSEALDGARKRLIEPAHVDTSPYGHLLPATNMAATLHPITIGLNLAGVDSLTLATED